MAAGKLKGPLETSPARPELAAAQRLDKWLWFARVVKTRTQATALVAEGRVRVNRQKTDKPSQAVRAGDVITVAVGARVRILEVLSAGERRGSATDAATVVRDLTPKPEVSASTPQLRPARQAERMSGTGRPTKRERRQLDRWIAPDDD